MKASPIQTSFNGGELSPLVAGRVDITKYTSGCKRMTNFLPIVQGPAIARPGFVYVGEVKTSANRTWLIRFEFSVEESYIIEFGNLYCRFYTNRAQVLSGMSAYEISSPYSTADLTNADGTLALRYAQTGDTVYITHPDHPPYLLSRIAPTNWTLAAIAFSPPPFKAQNTTATTIYASAATGSVALEASANIFSASMVGQYIYLAEKDVRDNKLWEAGASITAGDVRRSDGKNYEALNTATTGSSKPIHSSGAVYDGDAGVQWQFLDSGYGWAQITGYTDANTVTATVVSRLPTGVVSSGQASTRWALQAWNATDGYPSDVTFFQERLVFSRDATLWFSVVADFQNFAYEIDGEITADAGFDRTISSDRINSIRWLSPGDVLLVGTLGDEWAVTESTATDPFGPANVKTKRQSTYGSSRVAPVKAGASNAIFVQKSGRKLRAMAYRYEEDGFVSPDITAFAEHLTSPYIIDLAYQQEPWAIVWGARSDGVLVGCTYNTEQEVIAWHEHPLSGGVVECVECIPSADGTRDDLWAIVRYTVNGVTKRYIAYLADGDDDDTDKADWKFSDMVSTYSGAPATVISGLTYLEGKEVWVWADGGRHPNRTVSGGSITLQSAASKVQVGLPCEGFVETMNLEAGSAQGTAQGKQKRIHFCVTRVHRTVGGVAGPNDDTLQEIRYRTTEPMGSPPSPYTGDVDIEWDGDYSQSQTLVIKKDRPSHMAVLAVMPQLVSSEGR